MNRFSLRCVFTLLAGAFVACGAESSRKANLVMLTEAGVKNLRIETAVAEPGEFEETVFALGRIDVYPGKRAIISSRIPGRALEVFVRHDHPIKQGDVALTVESRQYGEPPPTIKVTAPISGIVSVANVVPGQPVEPEGTLAEILDLTEVYALARVPDHLAGRLKPGQKARITVTAAPGRVFEAALEHFGATADVENGTVEAAFHIENPGMMLRPGMRAEFSIVVNTRSDVVSVPRSALQGDPAGRFVYVKDFDLPNAFLKTPVVVGQTTERSVEIVSGLLPADEVVTQGAYSLAYAGSGSVSLKEALDAAHGHSHNADGSEITADQKKAGAAVKSDPSDDHGHSHGHGHGHDDDDEHEHSPFWMIVSGMLFALLLVVGFMKRPREAGADEAPTPSQPGA